ncbi:MAG TPA: succinate dehydrogenase cytochrome b subunit [Gemmataceae bacterium]|nr:succinate dehydrogenase cytochrome b subunit [Gemmataceae bacterium]
MNRLSRLVLSSVGSKYVMALTGLGLTIFVIAHMSGNLLIYFGKDALNAYAHGLMDHPGLLWTARIGLLAIFLIHMFFAFRTWQDNQSARPIGYVRKDWAEASWASRYMMLTGIVILLFVIYHLLHFTFGVIDPSQFKYALEPKAGDVAGMVIAGFQQPLIAVPYIVAQIFLGLHLWHGGSSWLQHLGLNGRGYDTVVNNLGAAIALIVVVGNCSIPLVILMRWIY